MSDGPRPRLAVLGSPIAHSKSPAIHRAAYAQLGLDWEYDAIEVGEHDLAEFVAGLGAEWRGLSLTMPLKRAVLPLLDLTDPLATRVGAANTVLLAEGGLRGLNTDVGGAVRALREAGVDSVRTARILGGGATAASVIAALADLGAERVVVSARSPERAGALATLGADFGVDVVVRAFGVEDRALIIPDVVVNTVPEGAVTVAFPEAVRASAVLFDVAYDPWPTPLAAEWLAAGGRVVSGFDLLVHQAIGQVRAFVSGDPAAPLPDEPAVLGAMRAALV